MKEQTPMVPGVKLRLAPLGTFLEMIKFEHSIFALPFAYLGLILAGRGLPPLHLILWITAAMVSFRTMAMAANRLIDAPIDLANPRTKNRALPAGKLRAPFVWLIALFCFALFEFSALVLGPLCFALSPVPAFLAWLYPFAKRFTWLSHWLLGIILGMAPYGAWIAAQGNFSWIPGCVMIGVASWAAGFDILYALQDMEFDRSAKLYSFPARFGREASLRLSFVMHLVTLVAWLWVGRLANLGLIYFAGLGIVTFLLLREHRLVWSFGMEKIQEAFFTMNAIVSFSIFLAVVTDLAWRGNY